MLSSRLRFGNGWYTGLDVVAGRIVEMLGLPLVRLIIQLLMILSQLNIWMILPTGLYIDQYGLFVG